MTITVHWWFWVVFLAALGVILGSLLDKLRGHSPWDVIPFMAFLACEMMAAGVLIGHFV